MKSKMSFNFLVCALALACFVTTGCRKKPVGVTPLPGSRTANVGGAGPGGSFQDVGPGGGLQSGGFGTEGGAGANATPMGSGHAGWKEDRGQFQADTVYFDYDSSTIKASERSKIEAVAAAFKSNTSATFALKIEGNCDERGTEEYNRGLGLRRAQAIRDYIINSGVAGDRVDVESFGEDKPVAQGHNEAAWKQNRRGEFVVLTP